MLHAFKCWVYDTGDWWPEAIFEPNQINQISTRRWNPLSVFQWHLSSSTSASMRLGFTNLAFLDSAARLLRRGPWRQRAAWRRRTVAVQGLFRAVPRSRASEASPIEKPAKTHAGQSHETKPQGLWKCHAWAIAGPPRECSQLTPSLTCFDFGDMLLIELESNLQFIYLLVINRGNWQPSINGDVKRNIIYK